MKRHYPKRPNPTIGRWYCEELDDGTAPPFPGALWQPGAGNAKTRKTQETAEQDLEIFTHTMSPGSARICPRATNGCRVGCVIRGGMSQAFPEIDAHRRLRNLAYQSDPEAYLRQLADQLVSIVSKTERQHIWRGNTGSDIDIRTAVKLANAALAARNLPKQLFYDYTKCPEYLQQRAGNHYLCFSRSEENEEQAIDLLRAGEIVAVVFHQIGDYAQHAAYRQRLPDTWQGFPVFNGDASDIRIPGLFDPPRPQDGSGYVIGLRLKGTYRQREAAIQTGFSVEVAP
jgi:hypothetical protein